MPEGDLTAVTVEFYGLPRARAGRKELTVKAGTAGEALDGVVRACPALADVRLPGGGLAPQYLLSLDGERFLTDLTQPLRPGDRLLLLSADAGG
jgi:molybdopterin converting factor small subunit